MKYHTTTHGPGKATFLAAFVKAVQIAKANGYNQVLLKGHALDSLKRILEQNLENNQAELFFKNRQANVDGVTVYLETEKTSSYFSKGVAFAPYLSLRVLNEVMSDPRVEDLVYVPWTAKELESFTLGNPDSITI